MEIIIFSFGIFFIFVAGIGVGTADTPEDVETFKVLFFLAVGVLLILIKLN